MNARIDNRNLYPTGYNAQQQAEAYERWFDDQVETLMLPGQRYWAFGFELAAEAQNEMPDELRTEMYRALNEGDQTEAGYVLNNWLTEFARQCATNYVLRNCNPSVSDEEGYGL